jgi:hypothetical protein
VSSGPLSKTKVNSHPSAARAKAEIRSFVLEAIGADQARVFDAFAGDGRMCAAVWCRAKVYVGCDLKWYRDDRLAYACDNRRLMRMLDLAAFNVFDFDSYGSPWHQITILAARRPMAKGERIGLVLTEGSGLDLLHGRVSGPLRHLTKARARFIGGAGFRRGVIEQAMAEIARRLGGRITQRWETVGRTGAKIRYIGLILEAV